MINESQRGFTLGEVLTGLAVVGISLSLAGPGLEALTNGNRQAVSVNELVTTLHVARSESITRNERIGVCASLDGERCDGRPWDEGWIAFVDDDADRTRSADEPILDRVAALAGTRIRSDEFTHGFSYRPNGRVVGDGEDDLTGEFAFCETGAEVAGRVVVIGPSGLPALSGTRRDGTPARCPTT